MTPTHPVLDLFATRHTNRNYKPEPLAQGDVDRILQAGRRAPTGALTQVYSVIRITDAELRDRLATLCANQQHIRDAAEFFIFCLDVHRARRLIEHQGGEYGAGPRVAVHYGTVDAMLVAANVATAAEALGYGTCYIGGVLNHLDIVAHELGLPKGVLPVVGLTIGVPDEYYAPPRKPRLPTKLVFHDNVYRDPGPGDLDGAYQAMGDAWCGTLKRFFGTSGTLARREQVWERALAQQDLKEPW